MKTITEQEQRWQYFADLAAGQWVWCPFAEKEARTADGFCQFCGKTDHKTYVVHDDDFLDDAYAQLPISETPWQCMLCGDQFPDINDLKDHQANTHPR